MLLLRPHKIQAELSSSQDWCTHTDNLGSRLGHKGAPLCHVTSWASEVAGTGRRRFSTGWLPYPASRSFSCHWMGPSTPPSNWGRSSSGRKELCAAQPLLPAMVLLSAIMGRLLEWRSVEGCSLMGLSHQGKATETHKTAHPPMVIHSWSSVLKIHRGGQLTPPWERSSGRASPGIACLGDQEGCHWPCYKPQ